MSLSIQGFVKTSLVDYPGKVCSVIFLGGCNFRCRYCYNGNILAVNLPGLISEKFVLDFLNKRKNMLDGVCISGGEPTLNVDLPDFINRISEFGLPIKLDSNGTNPIMLKKLIDSGRINYVAMDIKMPLDESYNSLVDVGFDHTLKIKKSLKLLAEYDMKFELRTTIIPRVHSPDLVMKMFYSVKDYLNDAELKPDFKWYLQPFKPGSCLDKSYNEFDTCTLEYLETLELMVIKVHPKTDIRM